MSLKFVRPFNTSVFWCLFQGDYPLWLSTAVYNLSDRRRPNTSVNTVDTNDSFECPKYLNRRDH